MPKIIYKKIVPHYFQQIVDGKKKFELRLADFDVQEGDILVLREWDHVENVYTGRTIEVVATYVLKTKKLDFWQPEDIEKHGFQIIQFDVQGKNL